MAHAASAIRQQDEKIPQDKLGLPFLALLLFPIFDYGRPANPLYIPMVTSIGLFLAWLIYPTKKWNVQIKCLLILLVVMVLDVVLATNTFAAYGTTVTMGITWLCVCIPLIHFVDSPRKVKIFINTLIGVFLYIGIYAIFHAGYGPGGSEGAQDENYVSAMMSIAIPLAYFSIPAAETKLGKVFFMAAIGIFGVAVIISFSRGGFLGMAGALLYCILNSPKKWQALIILTLMAVLAGAVAGPEYWEEMGTITDTKESTADLRIEFWTIAWRMFLANPVTGVGPGNYRWNVGDYQSAEQLEKFGHPLTNSVVVHSTYFEILAELGLAGSVLFLILLLKSSQQLLQVSLDKRYEIPHVETSAPSANSETLRVIRSVQQMRFFSRAIMGSLIGFVIPAAFISFTYFSHFWLLTALAVACHDVALKTFAIYDVRTGRVGAINTQNINVVLPASFGLEGSRNS